MIQRIQYITVEELNSVLGTCYSDTPEIIRAINEASEICNEWFENRKPSTYWDQDNMKFDNRVSSSSALNIKLGVAYQVEYLLDYVGDNIKEYQQGRTTSMGKISTAYSNVITDVQLRFSPRAEGYWKQTKLNSMRLGGYSNGF